MKTVSFVGEARVGGPWMERRCSVSSPAPGSSESPQEWLRPELTFQRPTTRLKSITDMCILLLTELCFAATGDWRAQRVPCRGGYFPGVLCLGSADHADADGE